MAISVHKSRYMRETKREKRESTDKSERDSEGIFVLKRKFPREWPPDAEGKPCGASE